jgi:hypothetical protein
MLSSSPTKRIRDPTAVNKRAEIEPSGYTMTSLSTTVSLTVADQVPPPTPVTRSLQQSLPSQQHSPISQPPFRDYTDDWDSAAPSLSVSHHSLSNLPPTPSFSRGLTIAALKSDSTDEDDNSSISPPPPPKKNHVAQSPLSAGNISTKTEPHNNRSLSTKPFTLNGRSNITASLSYDSTFPGSRKKKKGPLSPNQGPNITSSLSYDATFPGGGKRTREKQQKKGKKVIQRPKTPERFRRPKTTATLSSNKKHNDSPSKKKVGFFRNLFWKKRDNHAKIEEPQPTPVKYQEPLSPQPLPRYNPLYSDSSTSQRGGSQASRRHDKISQKLEHPDNNQSQSASGHSKSHESATAPRTTASNMRENKHGEIDQDRPDYFHEQDDASTLTNDLPAVDQDRPELFYAQDDVSTLTNPTYADLRKDPTMTSADSSTDPTGRHWREKVRADASPLKDIAPQPHFYQVEPAGLSPVPPKASLQVKKPPDTEALSDPVGEVPQYSTRLRRLNMHDPSPRGLAAAPRLVNDPVGESPLHKHNRGPSELRDGSSFAPDPPLYLKDDRSEVHSELSETSSEVQEQKQPERVVPRRRSHQHLSLPRNHMPQDVTENGESIKGMKLQHCPEKNVLSTTTFLTKSKLQKKNQNEVVANSGKHTEHINLSPEKVSVDNPNFQKDRKDLNFLSSKMKPSPTSFHSRQVTSNATTPRRNNVSQSKADRRSGSKETVESGRTLSLFDAAKINAKAVAQLYSLNGDPSPRRFWIRDDSPSCQSKNLPFWKTSSAGNVVGPTGSALFASYSKGKFKNRKMGGNIGRSLHVSSDALQSTILSKEVHDSSGDHFEEDFPHSIDNPENWLYSSDEPDYRIGKMVSVIRTKVEKKDMKQFQPIKPQKSMDRNISLSSEIVARGFEIFREKREFDVVTGRSKRVVLRKPDPKPNMLRENSNPFNEQYETLDPIQRAGRRLLARAAVPIQSAARRYLAQHEAVDRMWGLLEIQSYVRRWRAEAYLLACVLSAITLQSVIRGHIARKRLVLQNTAATTIQKIVRGYIVAVATYDYVYRIIRVQAIARGIVTRRCLQRHFDEVRAETELRASLIIQTWWRARSAQVLFQFFLVDTIIVQTIARRWLAKRHVEFVLAEKRRMAATKIQAIWRGFQGYTDYIFFLVDILVVQRAIRSWHARKEVQERRMQRAALHVQAKWRGFLVYNKYKKYRAIVQIQSAWRGYAVLKNYRRNQAATLIQKIWRGHVMYADYKKYQAAKCIQKNWRCFVVYNDFCCLLADIIRIQRAFRSWSSEKKSIEQLRYGAATKIQKNWRRYRMNMLYQRDRSASKLQKTWRGYHLHRNRSATKIQSTWRRFCDYTVYKQYTSARSIQSIWRTFREVNAYRQYTSARRIQSAWRGFRDCVAYKDHVAAIKIQKTWRRFNAYVDFIIDIANVLIAQNTARRYIAWKRVQALKKEHSILLIQTYWRRFNARTFFESEVRKVILVQAAARRFIANNEKYELVKELAAIKIQTMWRRFWNYSHYIILQYEVIRMQAIARGNSCRKEYNLHLGCCIMIQAAARRFLIRNKVSGLAMSLILARAESMREQGACKKIQFWWRIVLECRKEKRAALIIERFFIMVRAEVEREILLREQKKLRQKERKKKEKDLRKKKKENDAALLEDAWLRTFDSNDEEDASSFLRSHAESPSSKRSNNMYKKASFSPSKRSTYTSFTHMSSPPPSSSRRSELTGRYSFSPSKRTKNNGFSHRASSPTMNFVMRHELEDASELLASSPARRARVLSKAKSAKSPIKQVKTFNEDSPTTPGTVEKLVRKYNLKTAPEKLARNIHHFFADDLESVEPTSSTKTTYLGNATKRSILCSTATPHTTRSDTVIIKSRYKMTPLESAGKSCISQPSVPTDMPSSRQVAPLSSVRSSSRNKTSPRHGKILVMKPYPDYYPKKKELYKFDEDFEYFGEEFGII